jgi:hypothetical protein
MKNMAYLTKVVEKGKSTLEDKQQDPTTLETRAKDNIQILELPNDVGKNVGIRVEESDIPSSITIDDWKKRPSLTQQFFEFPQFDTKQQRKAWTNGSYDPFMPKERHDQRYPPKFNMQRV